MIGLPRLFPEELLQGYRGRIRLSTGLRDSYAVTAWLNGRKIGNRGHVGRERSLVELVAEHNGCSIYQVVMQHSLWAFTAAVDRPTDVPEIERLADQRSGRTAMLRFARPEAWLCQSCVSEDLAFWGVAYWRRNHQLPGAVWCDKHDKPLHFASRGRIEDGSPDHCLEAVEVGDAEWISDLKSNPTLRRFLEISSVVLESQPRLDRVQCAEAIRRSADGQGLCSTPGGIEASLVRLAFERLPSRWLLIAFPKVMWQHPAHVSVFNSAFRHSRPFPLSTTSLALAAALTFGTLNQALVGLGVQHGTETQADHSIGIGIKALVAER